MTLRLSILLAAMATSCVATTPSDRPNILVIMSDDHASNAIGVYQSRLSPLNPTPTLDRLASEGMVLENTFCSNAICSPSRATILTGQFSHINGVRGLGGKLPEEQQSLPRLIGQAGYQTAVVGKWHLGTQPLAFDYYKVLKGQGSYHNPEFFERVSRDAAETNTTESGYCTDLITDSSIAWLKQRDKTKPFLLLTHFKAPHGPWDAADRYDPLYADTDIPEPKSLWNRGKHGSIATRGHQDELLFNIGSSVGKRNKFRSHLQKDRTLRRTSDQMSDEEAKRASYRHYLREYLRCVRGVDDNIKRLLDHLDSDGTKDNTIIIYTSDQGMFLGEHDYIDKRWMYEEAMRMPFIIRHPKTIKPGSRSDALINNCDFAPTLLDYAGVPTPDSMQGRSFRSIMETGEEPADWRQATYYRYWLHMHHHYNPAHFGIRTKEWKLIFFYGAPDKPHREDLRTPPGWELYHIKSDPLEMNNLYGDPAHQEITAQLKETLKATRIEIGDLDTESPHITDIIATHWSGGNEEAIRISNRVAKNPVGTKEKKESRQK